MSAFQMDPGTKIDCKLTNHKGPLANRRCAWNCFLNDSFTWDRDTKLNP